MTTIGLVTIDDEAVTQQQRALVSALALHRRDGATIDMLIDALWPGRAPTTARKSLQNQVARMREHFGHDLIVTEGDRYRLDAITDVDSFREFEPLVGQVALTPDEEIDLAAVLAAWSGEPYAELTESPLAEAARAQLEHCRSRLVESLAASRLSRWTSDGVGPDAIADLTARTSTHPLHERAWELLVVALHLSGRRIEALGTYETFRSIVDQQLGVEPSHSFRRLRALVDADRVVDTANFLDHADGAPAVPVLVSA